jgi:hypothetical protein
MNAKTKRVFRGFIELNSTERGELITEMNKYLQGTRELQESLSKSIRNDNSINFGPAPGGCPCCGR